MTIRDLAALSPLLTQHINPYGRFDLDMDADLHIGTFWIAHRKTPDRRVVLTFPGLLIGRTTKLTGDNGA